MDDIEIVMAINDAYVEPAMVLITSICENHSGAIRFHFLDSRLSETSRRNLSDTISQYNNRWRFICMDKDIFKDAPERKNISVETYYRLMAFELLPELDRVLCLDGDMLAVDDIDELWKYDLKGKSIGAVEDQGKMATDIAHKLMIGMQRESVYVNAGVLLMDLAVIRERVMISDVLDIINSYGKKLIYQDQDVINMIFEFDKELLPKEYNLTPLFQNKTEFQEYLMGRDKMRPILIHYFGEMKPWKGLYGYKYFLPYRKYCLRTDCRKIKRSMLINTIFRVPAWILQTLKWAIYFSMKNRDLMRVFINNHGKYEQYLRDENVNKVVLYGAGTWGINVASELAEGVIDILYILDRRIPVDNNTDFETALDFPITGIALKNPANTEGNADLIIVTVEGKFKEIRRRLRQRTTTRMLSLEDFVYMKRRDKSA